MKKRRPNPIAGQYSRPAKRNGVIVGELGVDRITPYFARIMRELDWDIVEIDVRNYIPTSLAFHRKVIDRLLFKGRIKDLAQATLTSARTTEADFVLFAKGMGATPELLFALNEIGCKTVCWYPDVTFDHAIVDRRCLDKFDLFLTNKDFHLPFLGEIRGQRPSLQIDFGYLPNVHFRLDPPIAEAERPFDCVFIGNHSNYKQEWLEAIIAAVPAASFAIAGARWPRDSKKFPQERVFFGGVLTATGMARMINHGRIGLGIHHGAVGSEGWSDSVSTRSFEIPSCGTFMLHIDNPDIRRFYDPGSEIDVFSNPEEAAQKITYYLDHAEEREAMAERAWRKTVPAYSQEIRGREIAQAIETCLFIEQAEDGR